MNGNTTASTSSRAAPRLDQVQTQLSPPIDMVNELPRYQIDPQQWHSKTAGHNLRVVCVGAGAAGLLVAYKMKRGFKDYELVCYEK